MGLVPHKPYKTKKEFDKQAWRRDVASKCLIAIYGSNEVSPYAHQLAQGILNNVDALDKALEEKEEEKEETTTKCLYCGKTIPSYKSYCNFSCYKQYNTIPEGWGVLIYR